MLAVTARSVSRLVVPRHATVAMAVRTFAGGDKGEGGGFNLFNLIKRQPDMKVPTKRDQKVDVEGIPDFIPEDLKKEMEALGLDSIEDLDDLEEANNEGYNDLGLVPPEGSGTYDSPILVPSRRAARQIGYIDPESHAMQWFTIHNDDNTYYIQDLGLFFKMLHIPDESMASGHHH